MSITSPRVLGGRYHLHAMLGRGGMAEVWAGLDTRLDRPVAVKLLDGAARIDPVMVARLDREARTVAGLAHRNIVAVYDVGTEGGVPYLVMELVDGQDLHHRLALGPLDAGQAVGIAAQICDALQAAHEAAVVHRDVKPDNILLTKTGSVKVCDFGIARLQQAMHVQVTAAAATVGTSEYMAPEQATGGPLDARTDLYALGCVLYTMLTGGPPFSGDNPMRVLWRQVHEAPLPLASHRADIPTDLEAVVAELLAKDPADRPGSAAEVRARLAKLTTGPSPSAALTAPAAALPAGSGYGRAAVVTPTMTFPLDAAPLEGALEPAPISTGLRVGPAGIAAVAIGAAVITALVIALFSATNAPAPVAGPAAALPTTVQASVDPSATVANGSVSSVRTTIQAQVDAGLLNANDANDLTGTLGGIDRNLARGRADQAAKGINDLRDRLDELRNDNKVTNAGYVAILGALNQLVGTLPVSGGDSGRGDHSGRG